MNRYASWYDKSSYVPYHLEKIETEDDDGRIREFSVDFEFINSYTPPRNMLGRMEDAIPSESNIDVNWSSVIIWEVMNDGRKIDVTETVDEQTKAQIENQIESWVRENGASAFNDSIEREKENAELSRIKDR